jgi:hypothetical protein
MSRPLFVATLLMAACGSGDVSLEDQADAAAPGEIDATPVDTADADPPPPDATPPGEPDATPPAKRVVPIYITASDESQADIDVHVGTYNKIVAGIRTWYRDNLGEPTVIFYAESVRVMTGHYTKAEWDDFGAHGFKYPDGHRTEEGGGCAMYYGAEFELKDNGLLDAAGLPPLGTGGIVYYAINGGGLNGSCGAGGYLGASELQLLKLAQQNCPNGRNDGSNECSSVGAVAHEMGHGFGLPHGSDRPACTDGPTLMDVWWQYDSGAKLCIEDKSDLRNSGYFYTP